MLFKSVLIGMLLISSLSAGWAQPHLSFGLTGGFQMHPNRENYHFPLLGASAWYQTKKNVFVSADYVRYRGVDLYPVRINGLLPSRVHGNSRTQRFSVGLHFPIKVYNHSSRALLGINLGDGWEKRGYLLYESTGNGEYSFYGRRTEHLQRPVIFASLTALSQNKKLPFSLQSRFGYSFKGFFETSKFFLQVIAGINVGIL